MNFSGKNKRGVSVMIGYILLVVFVVIIGTVVFRWLVTYVPTDPLNCPDGVSVFVKNAEFNSSNSELNLTIKNNGRFNIAGYFIHAKNSSSQELATIDLSAYLDKDTGIKFGNAVLFVSSGNNALKPGGQKTNIFNVAPEVGELFSVRVIPTRFQEENNRQRFVSCGDSKVDQVVTEPGIAIDVCVADCAGGEKICGSDGCGGVCGTCDVGLTCDDAQLECYDASVCSPVTPDASLSGICGTQQCGFAANNTCPDVLCGTCDTEAGFECISGQCESNVNDGVCDPPGEDCTDTDCEGEPAQCPAGVCSGGICVSTGGAPSCINYCLSLNQGYTTSNCPANNGQCTSQGGDVQVGGSQECVQTGGSEVCCCSPAV